MTLSERIAAGPDPEAITAVARGLTGSLVVALVLLLIIILSKPRSL